MTPRKFDGREAFDIYPTGDSGRHWVYVVGIESGVVKFGRSCRPRGRIVHHWLTNQQRLQWTHLGPSFDGVIQAGLVERTACQIAATMATQVTGTKETFAGMSRAQAIACLRMAIPAAAVILNRTVRKYTRRQVASSPILGGARMTHRA